MSRIEQYEVFDCLTLPGQSNRIGIQTDAGDEYHDNVSVYISQQNKSMGFDLLYGTTYSAHLPGIKVTPSALFSPGAGDFCLEISFFSNMTYEAPIYDLLKEIDPPIFQTGEYSQHNNSIAIAIINQNKGSGVGLNGLIFQAIDSSGNIASVQVTNYSQFESWLYSSGYRTVTVGRRGQFFYIYANGGFASEIEFPSFGAVNIPEPDICYFFTTHNNIGLNNAVDTIRFTIGGRANGLVHIHKPYAFLPVLPSAERQLLAKTLGDMLEPITGCVHLAAKPSRSSSGMDEGTLYIFDKELVRTKGAGNFIAEVRPINEGKRLVAQGTADWRCFLDDIGAVIFSGGLRIEDSLTNFFTYTVFSVTTSASGIAQEFLYLSDTAYSNKKIVKAVYLDGEITVTCYVVDAYQAVVSTHSVDTIPVQNATVPIVFGLCKNSSGLFATVNRDIVQLGYSSIGTMLEIIIGRSAQQLRIHDFFYSKSNLSSSDFNDRSIWFIRRGGTLDFSFSVIDDTASTTKEDTASGNVLLNDGGFDLYVSKVNGMSNNVGVAVDGDSGGTFTIASDGAWTFDPDGDFALLTGAETATTSVTYYASDGTAEASATLTITVTSAGAQPWTPAEITGAIVFDALDSARITLNGSAVTAWADMLGSGTTASQATPALQPAMGMGEVIFNADYLTITGSKSEDWVKKFHSTGGHIFALVKFGTVANPNTIYALAGTVAASSAEVGFCVNYDDRGAEGVNDATYVIISRGTSGKGVAFARNQNTITPNTPHLISVALDPATATAGNRVKSRIDEGSAFGSNTLANNVSLANATYDMQIGAIGSAFPLVGSIYMIAFLPPISDADRQRLAGWAAHRYGQTALLPADHPYKSDPPTI